MEKIQTVKDLPSWFDLGNYRATENFDAAEWFRQLSARKLLLLLLSYRPGATSGEANAVYESLRDGAAKAYCSHSVRVLGRLDLDGVPCEPVSGGRGVDNLSAYDLFEHAINSCGSPQDWIESITPEDKSRFPSYEGESILLTTLGSIDRPVFATAKIALDMPDALLFEAFKVWLAEVRKSHPQTASAKYHKPTYKRWSRYGVLPYLDLKIWTQDKGIHIPDRVLSAAVSHYDAGEVNLRKTVAPLAERLMIDLSDLRSLAAIEAAERNCKSPESFQG